MGRRRAIVLGMAVLLSACQSGTTAPTSPSPSSASSATPSMPIATTATTATPQATRPLAWPRPTDLPVDGACDDGHSCLGLLKPGTVYRTKVFEPAITFSVSTAAWENLADEGGIFHLTSMSAPGDEVAFFREPRAADASVGPAVPDLAAWLASNPKLQVTTAKAVEVGGLSGVTLDIRVAPDATNDDPSCPLQVCVDLFKGTDPDPSDPYFWTWDWGAAGPEIQRLYLLTWPHGVLAIFVDSIDGTTFEELTKAFDQVLPTLRFG